MLQREVFPTYREYCKDLENAYAVIKAQFQENSVEELCKMRGYIGEEQKQLLTEIGVGCCNIYDLSILGDRREELGLTVKNKVTGIESFILNGRYIVPIRDIAGNLVALVAWYPDFKKYITTPSLFFSKNALYFNLDHAYKLSMEKFDGLVFLVEGIFDALSLRAIGLPVIATMGITVDEPKSEILKLFKKVIAIPDSDKAGNRAVVKGTQHTWKVPSDTTFIRLKGVCQTPFGELKVKDTDNLVSYFDDVAETLLQYKDSIEVVEVLQLS